MIRASAVAAGWPDPDVRFFEFLISGFYKEYRNWNKPGPVRDHLWWLHDKSPMVALELMAHAYLHMAYDLPRTIADALDQFQAEPPQQLATFRLRFLELERGFQSAADEIASQSEILGASYIFNKIAPRRWKLSYVFAVWVLRIRSNAYLQAESMFELPLRRSNFEKTLCDEVIKGQQEMIKNAHSPLFWFRLLGTPVLNPAFLVVLDRRTWLYGSYVVAAILVLVILFAVVRYLVMVWAADRLGASTYVAAQDAFALGEPEPRG